MMSNIITSIKSITAPELGFIDFPNSGVLTFNYFDNVKLEKVEDMIFQSGWVGFRPSSQVLVYDLGILLNPFILFRFIYNCQFTH